MAEMWHAEHVTSHIRSQSYSSHASSITLQVPAVRVAMYASLWRRPDSHLELVLQLLNRSLQLNLLQLGCQTVKMVFLQAYQHISFVLILAPLPVAEASHRCNSLEDPLG